VAPKDRKKVVASGQVEGVVGELFHFKKIQEGAQKVVVWQVTNGNVELVSPNEDDCLAHRCLKDVEGTTKLWEEENLLIFQNN
jgi:hypothetical protein